MALRILLLTTDSYGGHGGIALYNRDIAEALVAMPEVEEVVIIPRKLSLPLEPMPAKVRFLSQAAGSKARYVKLSIREAFKSPDLIICGHINLLPLAVLLNVYLCTPLVLIVYGIDVWQMPNRFAKQWVKKVHAIWSISAITRDRMNVWVNLPEDKFVLLPNAIHLERYGMKEKRADLVARYGLSESKLIMTLARLLGSERYKGWMKCWKECPLCSNQNPRSNTW